MARVKGGDFPCVFVVGVVSVVAVLVGATVGGILVAAVLVGFGLGSGCSGSDEVRETIHHRHLCVWLRAVHELPFQ